MTNTSSNIKEPLLQNIALGHLKHLNVLLLYFTFSCFYLLLIFFLEGRDILSSGECVSTHYGPRNRAGGNWPPHSTGKLV